MGLVEILLARRQPDGDICFATYLIDKYCLGLKDTFGNAGFSLARYQNEVRNRVFRELKPEECPIELAHQMIYQSIDYAAQFGFQPEKDFAYTQYLLGTDQLFMRSIRWVSCWVPPSCSCDTSRRRFCSTRTNASQPVCRQTGLARRRLSFSLP